MPILVGDQRGIGQIDCVIPLSSRFYCWFLYIGHMVLAPLWSLCSVAIVVSSWVDNIAEKKPWLPLLIPGGSFATASVAGGLCAVRFMRKFADRVVLDAECGQIRAIHRGKPRVEPVGEVDRVVFTRMGGLAFVELTFKSGVAYRLIPFLKSTWRSNNLESRLGGNQSSEPLSCRRHNATADKKTPDLAGQGSR